MTSVLILDDDPLIRRLMMAVVQDEGHTVRTAGDGEEALRILTAADEAPNSHYIVLVDIMLPGMSGLEFLQIISADARIWSRIGCIVVTAYHPASSSIADLARATQTSIPFLEKPFAIETLLDTINAMSATLPPLLDP